MIKIYHNPRCSKSREALSILENSGKDFEVIKYLENTPSKEELRQIIRYLGISPEHLVRKNESLWKEKFKGKVVSNEAIIEALSQYPKLIERPIVVQGNKAIIGRPPELIVELIN